MSYLKKTNNYRLDCLTYPHVEARYMTLMVTPYCHTPWPKFYPHLLEKYNSTITLPSFSKSTSPLFSLLLASIWYQTLEMYRLTVPSAGARTVHDSRSDSLRSISLQERLLPCIAPDGPCSGRTTRDGVGRLLPRRNLEISHLMGEILGCSRLACHSSHSQTA